MHIGMHVKHLGARGGTEEYVRTVATALLERGHGVSVLYEELADLSGEDWSRFARAVNALPVTPEGRDDPADSLRRYLRSERPDVLYLHNATFTREMLSVTAGTVPVVPFVHDFRPVCMRVSKVFPLSRGNCGRALGPGCLLHMCSLGPPRGGSGPVSWNSLRTKLADRAVHQRTDAALVASRFMRDLLLRNGFAAERVVVNPLFSPSPPPDVPPPLPTPGRLLYLGQIQQFKGLPVLLDALRHLPPDVQLDVAGEGPWRSRCEARAGEPGLAGRVRFHGWVARDRLPALMASASAVVMPSVWNEPFGLAGVEAMAYARPVIAFDVGGVREWLRPGETGICVESLGAAALARAIEALWRDPEQGRRMGARGREVVLERLTLDRHVDQLLGDFARLRKAPGLTEVHA
jgi:glycosyltransferase involved in cell wall biosynthesis